MPYRIVLRGELRASSAVPLEGCAVLPGGGFTVITGGVIDQAQLVGVVNWLSAQGLEIVSLEPAAADDGTASGQEPLSAR